MEKWINKYQQLLESRETLVLEPLSYSAEDLSPVLGEDNIKFHHGKLAKTYVERYNNKEGDDSFNLAGAYLHNILFSQYMSPKSANKPKNNMLAFIEKHHGSFAEFQESFAKTAMGVQGSGWVYLARNGTIKTITNHQVKKDIVFLVDWWEHAWYLDYGPDKKAYLKNLWKIIDWDKISLKL